MCHVEHQVSITQVTGGEVKQAIQHGAASYQGLVHLDDVAHNLHLDLGGQGGVTVVCLHVGPCVQDVGFCACYGASGFGFKIGAITNLLF